MSVNECVYECRHPLWGGQGICSGQADPVEYTCLCNRGYLAIDSDGSPSCVRKSAVVVIFVAVALIACGASGYLLWQMAGEGTTAATRTSAAGKKGGAPLASNRGLKVRSGLRLYLAFVSCTASIIFGVAAFRVAGNKALLAGGVLQWLYLTTMPGIASVSPFIAEMWLEAIPSQMLSSNHFMIKLKELARKQLLFVQMGISGFVGCFIVGIVSLFSSLDTVKAARIVDLMISVTAAVGITNLFILSSYLTVIINRAKNKAAQSSRAFYDRAIEKMWTQFGVLFISAVGQIAAAGVLTLNHAGKRTPALLYAALVLNAIFAFSFSVRFNKLSHGTASPITSTMIAKTTWKSRWIRSGQSTLGEGKLEGGKPKVARSIGGGLATATSRVVPTDGDMA